MRKIIFMGRSGSGKTTLKQALRGEGIHYDKTQYIKYGDAIIDTPGEYCESKHLGRALALYAYEADVVGLLISSIEEFSTYSPASPPPPTGRPSASSPKSTAQTATRNGLSAGCGWRGVRRSSMSAPSRALDWTR